MQLWIKEKKMSRPNKCRRVCRMPVYHEFGTFSDVGLKNIISLNVEEFETIRLIDYMGFTQDECAKQMEIGRATVQSIYTDARKKVARHLVEGTELQISGGNYELCQSQCCNSTTLCHENNKKCEIMRGECKMKIAVTYEDGKVFQHFGHTEQFKIYEVDHDKIIASEVVDTNGSGHGALAGFLKERNVNVLICGGIGGGAKNALNECKIELFAGAMGDADAQVDSFLSGKLSYDPNTECNHHDHEHGNCEHHGGGCGNNI